ncbi:unnamed protein product [Candidula unifasciata]|uniref:ENTH domain-containing protein n=1 Tax=Candidula unifasciata TaxID=100452 RepID=A0A8S3Z3B9_9EUPU|nr:unnamed protein product [Candidula unifasciata]
MTALIAPHRISFVNKIGIILKATSDDESPTAGYLYKDINDISFESVGYCDSLVEFLVDRLKSRSCHVKFKVLKLMAHIAKNGSRDFQLGLRKHSDIIKECMKFGGPPHPLHGNVPYLMVRKISKELCEILYNMEAPSSGSQADVAGSERQQDPKYGGLGPARTGGAIQGFGNTPTQPKSLGETILDGIEKLGAKISETPSDRSSTVNYRPPVVVTGNMEPAYPSVALEGSSSKSTVMKKHQPGRAGGGWNDDDEGEEENNENNNDNGSKQFSFETDSLVDHTYRLQQDEVQADWKEESELVVSVVKEGSTGENGIFLSPSTVTAFLNKCSTLSCDKVVEILVQKLASQDAGVVLRSLQLLEGIIYNREELVEIDQLTVMCKESLVSCFQHGSSQCHPVSSQLRNSAQAKRSLNKNLEIENEISIEKLWSAVQFKSAKIILILQQLSSHKEILASVNFENCLNSTLPAENTSQKLETA